MLRRADNVVLNHRPFWLTGRGRMILTVGKEDFVLPEKITRREFRQILEGSNDFPYSVSLQSIGRTYWLFAGIWHWDNEGLVAEQVYALLTTKQQRRTAEIERAQAIAALTQMKPPQRRGAIPDDVRHHVWIRDEGKCQTCGTTGELQFDHIIPISMGGASTSENLQILCGPCNRRKGAKLS